MFAQVLSHSARRMLGGQYQDRTLSPFIVDAQKTSPVSTIHEMRPNDLLILDATGYVQVPGTSLVGSKQRPVLHAAR
jgi:hypothetical protein